MKVWLRTRLPSDVDGRSSVGGAALRCRVQLKRLRLVLKLPVTYGACNSRIMPMYRCIILLSLHESAPAKAFEADCSSISRHKVPRSSHQVPFQSPFVSTQVKRKSIMSQFIAWTSSLIPKRVTLRFPQVILVLKWKMKVELEWFLSTVYFPVHRELKFIREQREKYYDDFYYAFATLCVLRYYRSFHFCNIVRTVLY